MKKLLAMMTLAGLVGSAQGEFTCSAKVEKGASDGAVQTGSLTWKNTGSAIAAPYVRLEAGEGVLVRFTEADAWTKSLEFLATGSDVPVSRIGASASGTVPFLCKSASKDGKLELSWTLSSAEAFPWAELGAAMRPSSVPTEAWTYALDALKTRLGTTWDTYLARFREDADYLAELGRPVNRIDRLWQFEINLALGNDPVLPTLAAAQDAARSARGLELSFTRDYSSGLSARFSKGIFGYGWSDNYSTYAELTDDQTLVFRVPGGGSYSFTRATGSWEPEDARDRTKLTETADAYALAYQDGSVQTFSKGKMRTASIADNQGNALTFAWNGTQLQKVSHTDGQFLSFAYENGLVASVTDDCGRKTTYAYSGDLLASVTSSDGLVTKYAYRSADGTAAARALTKITYPDGTTREFAYDGDGLVASVSVNGGKEKTSIVREAGVVTVTSSNGGVTVLKTGISGEALETTDALGGVTTNGYTEDGLLASAVSPSGLRGEISHDALGRVTKTVSASGAATGFSYDDAFGNLLAVQDAKGQSVTYGYDKLGRGTSVAFPDGSSSKVEYNARGDVVKSTNRRSESVTDTYDALGRLTGRRWSSGRTFAYAYDAHGNLTSASDSETGAVEMQYDAADRLTRIAYPNGRGFTFAYDSCGRLAKRVSLDGAAEVFSYDVSGRLAEVNDGNGTTYLRNAYDAATGRLTRQTYGNGTRVDYLYDLMGRVVSIEHRDASGKVLEALQYCYDADGRCLRASSLLGEERYGYDKDGQLVDVTYPETEGESFAYDAVGNRTSANGVAYTANKMNQYTRVGSDELKYDTDGNLVSVKDAKGTTTYAYDTLNRLVSVKNAAAGIDWSCKYDALGNRVSVTDNGVTTERVYLPGSLPSVAAEYVNGKLSSRHVLVGAVRVADLNDTIRYYHADLIGSTRLTTDAAGQVTGRAAYKAFGDLRAAFADVGSAGYVGTLGVETDPTGLLFMRNRYYSPALGRFIQPDPIGMSGEDENWYRYCVNSPIGYHDESGRSFIVGALVGGVATYLVTGYPRWADYNAHRDELCQTTLPTALSEMERVIAGPNETNFHELSFWKSILHKLGFGAGQNRKFVNNEHCEAVYDAKGKLVLKGINKGTNNYCSDEDALCHFDRDMMPWFVIDIPEAIGGAVYDFLHDHGVQGDNVVVIHFNRDGDDPTPGPGDGDDPTPGPGDEDDPTPDPGDEDDPVPGSDDEDDPINIGSFTVTAVGSEAAVWSTASRSMTVLGSFRATFSMCIDCALMTGVANFQLFVDGVQRAGTHSLPVWLDFDLEVQGEGTHTLEWVVNVMPATKNGATATGSVANMKIIKTAKKTSQALARSGDSKTLRASRMLSSATKRGKPMRIYACERYVAVKGYDYSFALSADDGANVSVSGLPAGFTYAGGIISGKASAVGSQTVTISAAGSGGSVTKDVTFEVIDPPTGFENQLRDGRGEEPEAPETGVRAGVWTVDVDGVRKATDCKLVVVLSANYGGCAWSQAAQPVFESAEFLGWAAKNGVYLVTSDGSHLPAGSADATDAATLFSTLYWSVSHPDSYVYYPSIAIVRPANFAKAVGYAVVRNDGEQKVGGVQYDGTPASLIKGLSTYLTDAPNPPAPMPGSDLYPEGTDKPFTGEAAATYDGYLLDAAGAVVGTINVKTAKVKEDRKTGAKTSAVTVTVNELGQKKRTLKGTLDLTTGELSYKVGPAPELAIGRDGITGSYRYGHDCTVVGARNFFAAKPAEKGDVFAKFDGRTYTVALKTENDGGNALANGYGTLSIAIGAKGKVKTTGVLADGTKVSVTGQLLVGANGVCCVPVLAQLYSGKSGGFGFLLKLDAADPSTVEVGALSAWDGGSFEATWSAAAVGASGSLNGGSLFNLEDVWDGVNGAEPLEELLPRNESVVTSGAKWIVAKAGKVKLEKSGALTYDAKANPSGLKLTYAAKTGLFTGSFSVYTLVNGKLKKASATVSGAVVGGVGYGTATVKKVGSVPIVINGTRVEDDDDDDDDPDPGPCPEPEEPEGPPSQDARLASALAYGYIDDSSAETGNSSWPTKRGLWAVTKESNGSCVLEISSSFGKATFRGAALDDLCAGASRQNREVVLTGSGGETLTLGRRFDLAWYFTDYEGSVTGGIFGNCEFDVHGACDRFGAQQDAAVKAGVKAYVDVVAGTYRLRVLERSESERQTSYGYYPYEYYIDDAGDSSSSGLTLTVARDGTASVSGTMGGTAVSGTTRLLFWTAADYANAIFWIRLADGREAVLLVSFYSNGSTRVSGDGTIQAAPKDDLTVGEGDFKAQITGIAVVPDFSDYDPARLTFVSPSTPVTVPFGHSAIFRVAYDFPEGYAAGVWLDSSWPEDESDKRYYFGYNPSAYYRGCGVAYGFITLDEEVGRACRLREAVVNTQSDPSLEEHGAVSTWTIAREAVDITFEGPSENPEELPSQDAQLASALAYGYIDDSSAETGSSSWPIKRGLWSVTKEANGSCVLEINSSFGKATFRGAALDDLCAGASRQNREVVLTGSGGETLTLGRRFDLAWYFTDYEGSVTGGIFGNRELDVNGACDRFGAQQDAAVKAGVKAYVDVVAGTYRLRVSERSWSPDGYPYQYAIFDAGDSSSSDLSLTVARDGTASVSGTMGGTTVSGTTRLLFWTAADYANAIFWIRLADGREAVLFISFYSTGSTRVSGDGSIQPAPQSGPVEPVEPWPFTPADPLPDSPAVTTQVAAVSAYGFLADVTDEGTDDYPMHRGTWTMSVTPEGQMVFKISSYLGDVSFHGSGQSSFCDVKSGLSASAELESVCGEHLVLRRKANSDWYENSLVGTVTGGIFGSQQLTVYGRYDFSPDYIPADMISSMDECLSEAVGVYSLRIWADGETGENHPNNFIIEPPGSGSADLTLRVNSDGTASLTGVSLSGARFLGPADGMTTKVLFRGGGTSYYLTGLCTPVAVFYIVNQSAKLEGELRFDVLKGGVVHGVGWNRTR